MTVCGVVFVLWCRVCTGVPCWFPFVCFVLFGLVLVCGGVFILLSVLWVCLVMLCGELDFVCDCVSGVWCVVMLCVLCSVGLVRVVCVVCLCCLCVVCWVVWFGLVVRFVVRWFVLLRCMCFVVAVVRLVGVCSCFVVGVGLCCLFVLCLYCYGWLVYVCCVSDLFSVCFCVFCLLVVVCVCCVIVLFVDVC